MRTEAISASHGQSQNKSNVQFKALTFTPLLKEQNPEVFELLSKSEKLQAATSKKDVIIDKFASSVVVKFKKMFGIVKEGDYINPSNITEDRVLEAIKKG